MGTVEGEVAKAAYRAHQPTTTASGAQEAPVRAEGHAAIPARCILAARSDHRLPAPHWPRRRRAGHQEQARRAQLERMSPTTIARVKHWTILRFTGPTAAVITPG